MNSLAFAWGRLVRQPARAALGILGVAAVGALLFDMLLLSHGLVVSLQQLLDGGGVDVRVMSTDAIPVASPRIRRATATAATIAALPEVEAVVPIRMERGRLPLEDQRPLFITLIGAARTVHPTWTLRDGRDLHQVDPAIEPPPILVSRGLVTQLGLSVGGRLRLAGACGRGMSALPPLEYGVVGIAEFPFEGESQLTAALNLPDVERACGEFDRDQADVLMVTSRPQSGADAAAEAIERRVPGLYSFTNAELVDQFEQIGLAYFRQISAVLGSVTLLFGLLLVTTILTVSVNQRFGEIAALRALGFRRRRIVTDLLCESAVFVGAGGLLALPLGVALATWLDTILRTIPGIPDDLHFFVFQPRALVWHVGLMALTSVLAALYPMHLAVRLPIASTLRNEVLS